MKTELLPCPFCGGTETQIKENGKMWTGMKYSEPVSVSILHWCSPIEGQPSRVIERIGKNEASAIAAWNLRSAPPQPEQPAAVALTDEQINELGVECDVVGEGFWSEAHIEFARAIERALGIKAPEVKK